MPARRVLIASGLSAALLFACARKSPDLNTEEVRRDQERKPTVILPAPQSTPEAQILENKKPAHPAKVSPHTPATAGAKRAEGAPASLAVSPMLTRQALAAPKMKTRSMNQLELLENYSGAPAEDKDMPGAAAKQFHTEEYSRIYENPFLAAHTNPLSTFSIDVDAASYANARRFLQGNQLPPADAVRIEEFINYFDYDYPQPQGADPFSITTEVAATPWNAKTRLVHIGLQGRKVAADKLPPSNLVFLLDVSGSMDSPEKLPLLKRAFQLLVDQMRPVDRISICVYAGAAGVVLPPTSGADKAAISGALERLQAGGSTAGGEGLVLAYKMAREAFLKEGNNRIILATDGDFNVGVSSDAELVRMIEEKRKSGVFLSILGFGMGNYKDSKMEQLADKGNGNYAYIDNIMEARKVLVEEIGGTLLTLAKDVKLQIEFNPAKVEAYRLIGYENRMLRSEDFNDDSKDAGELGAGHSVTALYEVVPAGTGMKLPPVDALKYQKPAAANPSVTRGEKTGDELLTVKFRYKEPTGSSSKLLSRVLQDENPAWDKASENFRFSAAVAGLGLMLRDSQFKGDLDYAKVIALGKGSLGRDAEGHRAEFIRLAEAAKLLSAGQRLGSRQTGK